MILFYNKPGLLIDKLKINKPLTIIQENINYLIQSRNVVAFRALYNRKRRYFDNPNLLWQAISTGSLEIVKILAAQREPIAFPREPPLAKESVLEQAWNERHFDIYLYFFEVDNRNHLGQPLHDKVDPKDRAKHLFTSRNPTDVKRVLKRLPKIYHDALAMQAHSHIHNIVAMGDIELMDMYIAARHHGKGDFIYNIVEGYVGNVITNIIEAISYVWKKKWKVDLDIDRYQTYIGELLAQATIDLQQIYDGDDTCQVDLMPDLLLLELLDTWDTRSDQKPVANYTSYQQLFNNIVATGSLRAIPYLMRKRSYCKRVSSQVFGAGTPDQVRVVMRYLQNNSQEDLLDLPKLFTNKNEHSIEAILDLVPGDTMRKKITFYRVDSHSLLKAMLKHCPDIPFLVIVNDRTMANYVIEQLKCKTSPISISNLGNDGIDYLLRVGYTKGLDTFKEYIHLLYNNKPPILSASLTKSILIGGNLDIINYVFKSGAISTKSMPSTHAYNYMAPAIFDYVVMNLFAKQDSKTVYELDSNGVPLEAVKLFMNNRVYGYTHPDASVLIYASERYNIPITYAHMKGYVIVGLYTMVKYFYDGLASKPNERDIAQDKELIKQCQYRQQYDIMDLIFGQLSPEDQASLLQSDPSIGIALKSY
ncbi:hypothetical protein SAMD00019534_002870 [Acytostelium subglobosum LB1]|uniref:hypothetical protein n=1 Tax=Acytostelium subglobosum LB1 TaxID=1410327 RepID=UPI000644B963|nr:hypothetical protein SAMD00019534_002870 [Acytostelium subglobosum LB1]GAM17112.1 hypothetical protein SAMD00019534_002870 [Acytostelium subglobosum LB1]|eukprot:XP_012759174.1 hypothetical protein SAMD00019534_002870 [Acytostelium subglobosum LB1]